MNPTETTVHYGRAVLGCLLESPDSWPQAAPLTADDFQGDDRKIFAAIQHLKEHNCDADIISVAAQLGDAVPVDYLSRLVDGVVHNQLAAYVRQLRDATKERKLNGLIERLKGAKATDERLQVVGHIQAVLTTNDHDSADWRTLFHTKDEIENAPPLRFAIDGFLQEEGITLIGGLAGHGKTLCMLAMVRALLEEGNLFTKFKATRPADRVLYLIPEAGLSPFSNRLKTFRLTEYLGTRLFVRTLSAKQPLSLSDPRLLQAAEGADVFLDTAIRFMQGDENDASEQRAFAESLFRLQNAGARTITGAHHSPKSFARDNVMTLENVLRGSGDIGAMLVTAWGLKQIDSTANRIYVANVKPRDFQPCEPFIIQGRPSLDQTGYFELTEPPGFAGSLEDHKAQGGRPAIDSAKMEEAQRLHAEGKSYRQISATLDVSPGTLSKWLGKGVQKPVNSF